MTPSATTGRGSITAVRVTGTVVVGTYEEVWNIAGFCRTKSHSMPMGIKFRKTHHLLPTRIVNWPRRTLPQCYHLLLLELRRKNAKSVRKLELKSAQIPVPLKPCQSKPYNAIYTRFENTQHFRHMTLEPKLSDIVMWILCHSDHVTNNRSLSVAFLTHS